MYECDHMDTFALQEVGWGGAEESYTGADLAAGLLLRSVCKFPTQEEENRKLEVEVLRF